jgi:hypothetical protein
MAASHKLHCYEYVNRPYEQVRDALAQRGPTIFQRATTSAANRTDRLVSKLHVGMAGFDVSVDIRIKILAVAEDAQPVAHLPAMRMTLRWEAAHVSALFPSMTAVLSAWPLYGTETQLEVDGRYALPLGIVGNAVDTIVGHRLADATVHRFLEDIVEQLRLELPAASPADA